MRLARRAPVGHLLHALEGEDVLLPLGGQVDVGAEVVEALGADAAVGIRVHVRHLEPHLAGRVLRRAWPRTRCPRTSRRRTGPWDRRSSCPCRRTDDRARADLAVEAGGELRAVARPRSSRRCRPPRRPSASTVVVPLVLERVPVAAAVRRRGRFWLLPSSPSSIIPVGPQSLKPGRRIAAPAGRWPPGAGAALGGRSGGRGRPAGAAADGRFEAAEPGAAVCAWGGGITQPESGERNARTHQQKLLHRITRHVRILVSLEPDDRSNLEGVLVATGDPARTRPVLYGYIHATGVS